MKRECCEPRSGHTHSQPGGPEPGPLLTSLYVSCPLNMKVVFGLGGREWKKSGNGWPNSVLLLEGTHAFLSPFASHCWHSVSKSSWLTDHGAFLIGHSFPASGTILETAVHLSYECAQRVGVRWGWCEEEAAPNTCKSPRSVFKLSKPPIVTYCYPEPDSYLQCHSPQIRNKKKKKGRPWGSLQVILNV